jgi:hypothetical protein
MSQAATWEPQTTRRRPQEPTFEVGEVLSWNWINDVEFDELARLRANICSMIGFQGFMAILHKADFI